MTEQIINLSTGETLKLIYSYTFGEMAITATLLAILVVYCARWVYDAIYQMWYRRLQ